MMTKYSQICVGLLIVSFIGLIHVTLRAEEFQKTEQASPAKNRTLVKLVLFPGYQMEPDSNYDTQKGPFRIIGSGGGMAKIIDNATKQVVARSTETETFFNLAASPGKTKIVAFTGDGASRVFDTQSQTVIDIPAVPPGGGRLGFKPWVWLSEDVLLSISGVRDLGANGQAISSSEEPVISKSELYAFSLQQRVLTRIELPQEGSPQVFEIGQVSKTGFMELLPKESHVSAPTKSVWFKVILK